MAEENFESLLSEMFALGQGSVILQVSPSFAQHFVPKSVQSPLPKPLSHLFRPELDGRDLPTLLEQAESLMQASCKLVKSRSSWSKN